MDNIFISKLFDLSATYDLTSYANTLTFVLVFNEKKRPHQSTHAHFNQNKHNMCPHNQHLNHVFYE
jgi:hypothetical protein